ncbi:MAG: CYTH domain-containing protein [Candidatus Aenigmatarchaeota archaeon]
MSKFNREIETKFRVDEKLSSKLKSLNLVPHEEIDEYFFTKENVTGSTYLRFRKKKGKVFLNLKNVIIGGTDVDIYESEEIMTELTAEQYEKLRKIFEILFPIKLQVRKIRKTGKYGQCEICHDSVDDLGEFFEIEGSRENIKKVCEELDIDNSLRDREKGYVEMTLKKMGLK